MRMRSSIGSCLQAGSYACLLLLLLLPLLPLVPQAGDGSTAAVVTLEPSRAVSAAAAQDNHKVFMVTGAVTPMIVSPFFPFCT